MLTEEKLQKFIDDLRLGKYDIERYHIGYDGIITDKQNDTTIIVRYFKKESEFVQMKGIKGFFRKYKYQTIQLEKPEYIVYIDDEFLSVSQSLYQSFKSYFDEIQEKDRLVRRLNIKESFGLD